MFGKLRDLFASKPPLQLVVEGTVTDSGRHAPRTHLGPNQASEEAWFALALDSAALTDGTPRDTATIQPAEFSGGLELLERVAVGDRVRITTTTLSGREIGALEKL